MGLRTVKVPSQMEGIFGKAEEVVASYFGTRKDDPSNGTIEIFGERYVLVRGAALSIEFVSLVRNLFGPGREAEGEEFARNILFDLAYSVGKSDARNFHAKMGLQDPIERLSAGPVHFAHSGWAFVDIFPESRPSPSDDYYLIYDHPYSFEADAWIRSGRQSHFPVCIMNSGYSSGWCAESFGLTLVASEILCQAKGDDCCRFIMAPPQRIEEHIAQYMREKPALAAKMRSYEIPDFLSRKRMEEELRRSEQQYRGIFEASIDALIIFSIDGIIVDANPAACAMYGYFRAEMVGMAVEKLVHHDGQNVFEQLHDQTQIGGQYRAESVNVRKDGSLLIVEISGSQFMYHGSLHLLGVLRDITQRKKSAGELLKAKETAEQANRDLTEANQRLEGTVKEARMLAEVAAHANRAKSEFLANMSHELRTPLTGVIGMTELLTGSDLSEEQRDYADTVIKCSESLLILINDILDFSKIEAGELELNALDFELQSMVEDVLEMLAEKAHRKQVEIACFFDPLLPKGLHGDASRLRQVLLNLVGNAVKFTERGEVVVRVEVLEKSQETVSLRFEVNDTGIGIAAEKMSRLFNPFSQADGSTTRKYGGTGLGLVICKRILNLMGGEIGAESQPDRGSAFWFTVDLRTAVKPVGEPIEPGGDLCLLEGLKVLIVDDNATSRELLQSMLDSWGVRSETVECASKGLQSLRDAASGDDPFRLLLADTLMPDMNGLDLAREIGNDPALASTPIILLTGVGDRALHDRSAEAVSEAVLRKPVRQRQLLDCLLKTLGADRPLECSAEPENGNDEEVLSYPSRRILVAEDNVVNQDVVRSILNKLGYHADVVANGREALNVLSHCSYDLILMDCQMPVMDGYAVTAEVRRIEAEDGRRRTPIIALTANATRADEERCRSIGMDDYVSKPIRQQSLRESIERLAGEKAALMDATEAFESRDVP